MIKLREKYVALIKIALDEVCEINIRNNFSHSGRSFEDEERSFKLWKKIRDIEDKFNKEHPLPNCPECGHERKASLNGVCTNYYGECSLVPPLGG